MTAKQTPAVERLRAGGTVIGTMLRMARHPGVVKIAGDAGFDFVLLDFEHGDFSFSTVTDMALLGRALNIGVMVRAAELSRAFVSRALDCGVVGVMAPMLETVEQARQLVQWSKYPPLGGRGLATTGGMSAFTSPRDVVQFMADANRATLAIAQIETATAIEAVDAIAAVEGIDVLLVGPNDLAVSLGKPGNLTSPEEHRAIGKVADAARRHGKVFAMHAGADMLRRWVGHDMRMIMNGLDINALSAGLASLATEARSLAEQAKP